MWHKDRMRLLTEVLRIIEDLWVFEWMKWEFLDEIYNIYVILCVFLRKLCPKQNCLKIHSMAAYVNFSVIFYVEK